MSIEYTYEIINVNAQARCMEVKYTATGRAPVHVSGRLPYQGESLEAVIDSFSPVRWWEERDAAVIVPDVGLSGVKAPPAPAPIGVADYVAAVQVMLDSKARERNYDGILSACTYATSTVPKFQAEGQACVAWRDAVWAACYDAMALVESGAIPQPTVAELVAMMPPLVWPV